MSTKVVMEALSPTMEEGRLVEWKKQEGEPVAVGDVLAEVETDKAVMELVARAGGTLLKQVVPAGTTVPVSELVAVIGKRGRYVPKDCYDPATGTAETAMLLVKGDGSGSAPTVQVSTRLDGEQTPGWWRMQLACRLASKAVRGVVGRRYTGRTWW